MTVNTILTAEPRQRRRRYVDTRDFGAMVARMIRAYGRRVQDADVEDLRDMVAMRRMLDEVIESTVTHMRSHQDFSWTAIGEAVGTTRQAAQQRYGRCTGAGNGW